MKYVIGIAPPSGETELKNYIEWISYHRFDYKILEKDEDPTQYDALILTGGADIGKVIERDDQEFKWLEQSYGVIPVLGVCRGMKLVNIDLGGTLYEDLVENEYTNHTEDISAISEELFHEIPSVWHSVNLVNFSMMIDENNNHSFIVNSRHHQGVDQIPSILNIVAISSDDGLIEALENKNCLLVQWHPERPEVRNKICSTIVIEWLRYKLNENEISKNRWTTID